MRAALIAIAFVVVIAGALTWWLLRDPTIDTTNPTDPITGTPIDDHPPEFKSTRDLDAVDAGVGRVQGRVLTAEETPAPGARVRLFARAPELSELDCGVCEMNVLDCGFHTTVRSVIDGIRSGRFVPPPVIAEVTTGADGAFVFEDVPLDGMLVATLGERSVEEYVSDEPVDLLLNESLSREVIIFNASQEPIPGVKVTVYEPYEGRVFDATSNAEGQVTLKSNDPLAWVFVEHPGQLPVGQPLDGLSQFELSPPKTLIVHTMMGGQPVDADVSILVHRQDKKFRTKDGVLRLDQLPFDYYTVTASSEALASAEQSIELVEPVTEITFELRRGARVLVTVLTTSGEPLEFVHGSLQGNDGNASGDAENGALLIIGPVPEGEYTLSVDSDEQVTVTKQLDLHPGDTDIEVTMRVAPTVKGRVLLPDGKPALGVRVAALEGEQEIALDFVSGDEGEFVLSFQYPGDFLIRAVSSTHGVAELKVSAPSAPVTLTLNPKGVLEVELFDFDGTQILPNFIVRSTTGDVDWINPDEEDGMVGRLAGLTSGTYTIEREIENRVPMKKTVEITEGKTTRVTFRADKGVSLSGKVVDAEGKPVANAVVTVSETSESVTTNEKGEFERSGLTAGLVDVFATHDNGATTEPMKVKVPATGIILKFAAVEWVTGRAVDDRGAAVTSFEANEVKFNSADGRFRVEAPSKTLDVFAEGYVSVYLSTASGDVGDVVLKKTPIVEGDVTDSEGKPVSGATVMGSIDLGGVVTDANGRFKLTLNSDEAQELLATRGPLSGRTSFTAGTVAHIVMQRGTTVTGRVVDATGKGVPSVVTAVNRAVTRPMEIDTDENGRFQVDLARGVWLFSARAFRSTRAIEITGDRMEITIGEEAGACGAIVHSTKLIDSLWFLPRQTERDEGPWELVGKLPGSMEVPITTPSLSITARGIPCGQYEIAASVEGLVSSVMVDLRQPAQQVEVRPLVLTDSPEEAPAVPSP